MTDFLTFFSIGIALQVFNRVQEGVLSRQFRFLGEGPLDGLRGRGGYRDGRLDWSDWFGLSRHIASRSVCVWS